LDSTQAWKEYFEVWPASVKRRGVLVTSFGEQVPFQDFMTHAGLLLIERTAPDTVGARMVLLPYSQIAGLKITDPLPIQALESAGFVAKAAAK
jgi:hypothetical protein